MLYGSSSPQGVHTGVSTCRVYSERLRLRCISGATLWRSAWCDTAGGVGLPDADAYAVPSASPAEDDPAATRSGSAART
jgi:hypothetical protein